jgi:hypothetical protein
MLPWDVLASGLKRFLRLGYIATTVAGSLLIAEVTILTLDGPPAHRRGVVGDWISSVPNWHVKTAVLAVLVASFLLGAYLVGAVARTLAVAVFGVASFIYNLVQGRVRVARERKEFETDRLRETGRAPERFVPPGKWGRRRQKLRRQLLPVYYALRTFVSPIFPLRPTSQSIWNSLEAQFGRDGIARVLSRHPIIVSRNEEWRMTAAAGYCQMWLQRFAPDLAVPAIARRTVLLLAAVAPAVLLPATLRAFASDLAWVGPWLGWVWLFLIAAGAIAVINSLREGSTVALYTFFQFVMVQFVEEGKPRSAERDDVRRSARE